MAEGTLTSLAFKVLNVIREFTTADVSHSNWPATKELEALERIINKIQKFLSDVERKPDDSDVERKPDYSDVERKPDYSDVERKPDYSAVNRNLIDRIRDALYDAEDLFDLLKSETLLKQQMKKNTHFGGEVRGFFSKLFPDISANKTAIKFKDTRVNLEGICKDMTPWESKPSPNQIEDFESGRPYASAVRGYYLIRPYNLVIGRQYDFNAIENLLYDESHVAQMTPVIAIVGLSGMGKTTVARLVYNGKKASNYFEIRWWVRIAGQSDEKAILARILESITGISLCVTHTISQLRSAIVRTTNARRYLLVLDGGSSLLNILPFLRNGAEGSRIIITTPSMLDMDVMHVKHIYQLHGLSEDESWELFERIASEYTHIYNPDLISLGRKIIKQCDGVPLAINITACLLQQKRTIEEWGFCAIEGDTIESKLQLSYDRLGLNLKQCLAYCSLFPQEYVFQKEELLYLWICQGFLNPTEYRPVEDIVDEILMELFDMSFFHDAIVDENGKVLSWTMNGATHNLARKVAGPESIMISKQFVPNHKKIRHLSVGYELDESWNIPPSLFDMDRPPLRSFLFLYGGSISPLVLNEVLTKFKLLRALDLRHQKIQVVPSSIGELKLLRYLNLSHNKFLSLPNSITMLVNLITLDISWCEQLELFPDKFRKLCNLRHLDNKGCHRLRHMPPDLEELLSLQFLSLLKVGKELEHMHFWQYVLWKLDLKGDLEIKFNEDMESGGDVSILVPHLLRILTIHNHPGMRIDWAGGHNLVRLHIGQCSNLKHLSAFKDLVSLKSLQLVDLEQLEYIEIEKDELSCLQVLKLEGLPKLQGWLEAAFTSHRKACLPVLSELTARCCQELKFMPLCPLLKTLELNEVNNELIQHLLSPNSNSSSSSMSSSSLETVAIWGCDLLSFPLGTLLSLRCLRLSYCYELKKLSQLIMHLNSLEEVVIDNCPKLELWGEEKSCIDWDLLPELSTLTLIGMPSPQEIPDCLQQRQSRGELIIRMDNCKSSSNHSVHSIVNKGSLLTVDSRPGKAEWLEDIELKRYKTRNPEPQELQKTLSVSAKTREKFSEDRDLWKPEPQKLKRRSRWT